MEDTTATEITTETPVEAAQTIAPEEDLEAKLAELEAEKVRLAEERANYREAEAKFRRRLEYAEEADEERLRRIAREELENSKLSQLDKEKDDIIKRALKENRELKLAHLNKAKEPPAAVGSHNESTPVQDTLITPQQMEVFKQKGWTAQDIERYKKSLLRGGGR